MKQIVHSMNFRFDPLKHYGYFDKDRLSETVPDHALSVRDILDRYVRNRPLPLRMESVFTGEDEFPDFDKMDELEKLDYQRENAEFIRQEQLHLKNTQERIARQKAEIEKAKLTRSNEAGEGGTTPPA